MTTNYANNTNYLAIRIYVISEIRSHRKFQVHIIKFNVQCSKFKGKRVHIIKFKVQISKFQVKRVHIIKFNVQSSMFKGKKFLVKKFLVK